jgi:hypothetical protein
MLAGGWLRLWARDRHQKRKRRAKAGRVAKNATASMRLSCCEETLRDVGKAGQAKRCCTN